jgi:two-component system sensor histidine kinase PilS (NtrC family)
MRRHQHPAPGGSYATFWRSLQTLAIIRIVIALVLLLYLSFVEGDFWVADQMGYGFIGLTYLVPAVFFGFLASYYQQRFLWQLLTQIVFDLCIISLVYLMADGAKSGLAILYLLPLAGAAILAPLLLALFFAATVALFLLGESAYQILFLYEPRVFILQAGLYGAAFFTVVLAVNRLALRLIKQEALALQRGRDLLVQEEINHLVIADVGDGILVLGPDSSVFAANPAAQSMLGWSGAEASLVGIKLKDVYSLLPVAEAFFAWLHSLDTHSEGGAPHFVSIKLRDEVLQPSVPAVWSGRREFVMHLKMRFVTVPTMALSQTRSVVFLQDVSEIENQAQQLKLASMGRLTASIAHEVRNPLAAMGHAAALLEEDLTEKTALRLVKIISDNVTRVNQMIEDILQLSRKVPAKIEPFQLQVFLHELMAEFQETHALAPGVLVLEESQPLEVIFDALHLREVVVNLLTNAIRYASGGPGSIRLSPSGDGLHRCELHVQDDGPCIIPEVRAHLFEPFYTTSSKGTGLGLYLAREMCLNNKAMLDYEYRIDMSSTGGKKAQGRFVISFALPDVPA